MHSLPRINQAYWLALIAASVFGTNTGDFVADSLHIGHLEGLPWLLGLLLALLALERVLPCRAPLWFWAAIITVRTAATNIGDAFHGFHLGPAISLPLTSVVFAGAVLLYCRRGGGVSDQGVAKVDAAYWLCMLLAGAWGTIAGDFVSFGLVHPPLRPALGTLVLVLPMALLFWGGRGGRLFHPCYYWLTVAFIRTIGTCAGDGLADALGGHDNVVPGMLVSGAVFIGVVLWFYLLSPGAKENAVVGADLRA